MKAAKKKVVVIILLFLPVLAGIALMLYLNLSSTHSIHLWDCPLFEGLGIECPGCGATRCVCAILTFRFAAAFKYNAVVFLAFFPFAALYLYNIYCLIFKNRSARLPSVYIYIFGAAVFLFFLIRNLPFYPWDLSNINW